MTIPRYFVHGDEMREGFYCAGCDGDQPPEHFISDFCLLKQQTHPRNMTSRKLFQMKLKLWEDYHSKDGRTRPKDVKNIHDLHPEIE